jgi:hypothetical protein
MDLPGWQAIYDELKDDGFELISAAQDTGGEEAAGQWFDRANATFTQIVDEHHTISAMYNMVNVPTGVWINEEGMIVRPNETAYSSNTHMKLQEKVLQSRGADYVAALKDWVRNGAESEYVLTPEEIAKRVEPRTDAQALAEAEFQLGNYFIAQGNDEKANARWEAAQKLRPESWNYHRQDWSFTPKEAGANWMKKFQATEGDYYPDTDIPELTKN